MRFSETLATLRATQAGFFAQVGEDWSQGRAVYGGMVAALGNEAMRRAVPAERRLRGLETVFVGPALPGELSIDTSVLRVGKAATLCSATLRSAGEIAAITTGIYGAARATALHLEADYAEDARRSSELAESVIPPQAQAPPFLQHFAMKFAEGTRPFSGTLLRRSKVYIRHRDPSPLTESHLVGLIDCIPPPLLQMMTTVVPASSLTWSLEFIRHDFSFAPDAWWRIDTEAKAAGEGYSQESSVVLDPDGRPAVFSRQLVAVFG